MVQDLITQLSDRGHNQIKHITFCDKERISEKRSGLDIYSSNLISYTLTDFRSWQESTSLEKHHFWCWIVWYHRFLVGFDTLNRSQI